MRAELRVEMQSWLTENNMNMKYPGETENKAAVRKVVYDQSHKLGGRDFEKRPHLYISGPECLDAYEGLKHGISPTQMLLVDSSSDPWQKKAPPGSICCRERIENIDFSKQPKFGFVYLDLMGNVITKNVKLWASVLQKTLSHNGVFAITFVKARETWDSNEINCLIGNSDVLPGYWGNKKLREHYSSMGPYKSACLRIDLFDALMQKTEGWDRNRVPVTLCGIEFVSHNTPMCTVIGRRTKFTDNIWGGITSAGLFNVPIIRLYTVLNSKYLLFDPMESDVRSSAFYGPAVRANLPWAFKDNTVSQD